MKNMIAKNTSAIVYAQCNEVFQPGTFQQTIDDIFKLNNFLKVIFPTQTVTTGITELFNYKRRN